MVLYCTIVYNSRVFKRRDDDIKQSIRLSSISSIISAR